MTIYRTPSKGHDAFTVAHYDFTGRLNRRMLADYSEARQFAIATAESLSTGQPDTCVLIGPELLIYRRALKAAKDVGLDLDLLAIQYADAAKALGRTPVLEAVNGFLSRKKQHQVTPKTVPEIVSELLKAKQEKGRSFHYLKDLRVRLERVAKAFPKQMLDDLTPGQIDTFLGTVGGAARTKNNFRLIIGTLIRFAQAKGYVARDHPGIAAVEKSSQVAREVEVFTPEQIKRLLTTARPELVPVLVIGAFAGLRSEELKRLDWTDVKMKHGHIEVRSAQSKTKVRRIIPITKNLKAWLKPLARDSGPVNRFSNLGNQFLLLAKGADVPWKRNGLRHSFVSYRIAQTGNVASVSLEAGNSPQVIARNYLKCVTASDARKWFGVYPNN